MMPGMQSPQPWAAFSVLRLAVALCAMAAASVCAKPAARLAATPTFYLKVVRVYPHDPRAFTQGLLFLDGKLYESTGLYARSSVRRVDLASGQVELESKLPGELFGEGLAQVGQRLFQLTWKNGKVLVWDLASLTKEREFSYDGEGWGLCFDGRHLVMSDGSDKLTLRSPSTFAKEGEINVRLAGHIARIDAGSGDVSAWIDATGLLDVNETAGADVLNGIANMPGTGHLLVTGKLWPHLYEVEVIPAAKAEAR
jgi:glutaminyl-peptide cyclotransferase